MFEKKELAKTLDFIRAKKNEILKSKSGSDLDYIQDLQTLIQLEGKATEKLSKMEKDSQFTS